MIEDEHLTHLLFSILCMITLFNTTTTWEGRESVLFQPVLKAYPMHHPWIITAHISLENLEKQRRMFTTQMDRTQQLLDSLLQKQLAPTPLFSTLQAGLINLGSIYTSCKPLILAATQLMKKEPSFNRVLASNRCTRRSLLPFFGDVLNCLTGTAMTKDVSSFKKGVNQLIATQHNQQETIVHVISILNVTRYATQVNRQYINMVMNAAEWTHQDITTLYISTHPPYSSLSYQQIMLHFCSILANLRDSLYYMREVTIHTMDYVDAAITGILSPHVLPVEDLRKMLLHITETLPLTMHLPVSSEDALPFYRYLCTQALIANEQFLLLTDIPIQDSTQHLEIDEGFNLAIPHRNFSA